jgi:hypothetical protein
VHRRRCVMQPLRQTRPFHKWQTVGDDFVAVKPQAGPLASNMPPRARPGGSITGESPAQHRVALSGCSKDHRGYAGTTRHPAGSSPGASWTSAPVVVKSRSAGIVGGETKLGRMGPRRPAADLRPAGPAQRQPGSVDRLTFCSRPAPGCDPNKPHSAAVVLI